MTGTIKWNLLFGLVGLVLTLLFSLSGNGLTTSVLRSFYSFWILFFAMFGFRWLLGTVVGLNQLSQLPPAGQEDHLGAKLDLTTPSDEESIRRMLDGGEPAASLEAEFVPLQPTKLLRKEEIDPELLAGALRRMTEE